MHACEGGSRGGMICGRGATLGTSTSATAPRLLALVCAPFACSTRVTHPNPQDAGFVQAYCGIAQNSKRAALPMTTGGNDTRRAPSASQKLLQGRAITYSLYDAANEESMVSRRSRRTLEGMMRRSRATRACCRSRLPRVLVVGMRSMASRWPLWPHPTCNSASAS